MDIVCKYLCELDENSCLVSYFSWGCSTACQIAAAKTVSGAGSTATTITLNVLDCSQVTSSHVDLEQLHIILNCYDFFPYTARKKPGCIVTHSGIRALFGTCSRAIRNLSQFYPPALHGHEHTHTHINVPYLSPNICLITPSGAVCHLQYIVPLLFLLMRTYMHARTQPPVRSHSHCEHEIWAQFVQFCMQSCQVVQNSCHG